MNRYRPFASTLGTSEAHTATRAHVEPRALAVLAITVTTLALCLACICSSIGAPAGKAYAQEGETHPGVLVIDAGLGDRDLTVDRWLGDEAFVLAQEDGFQLETAKTPTWYSSEAADAPASGEAPATYVLSNPEGVSTFKADTLIWALDRIRDTGALSKTIVVSPVATGLPVREYVEGLASQKLGDRNDIAGLVFCGTPHGGYSAIERYPELDAWNSVAHTVGLSVDDLKPASAYLDRLANGAFPDDLPVLNVNGVVGDLGFGSTDGIGTAKDFEFNAVPKNELTSRQVLASASQAIGLSSAWLPFSSRIDYPSRVVDSQVAERISAQPAYLASSDVIYQASRFYATFASGEREKLAGMTVLAIDLSGSMYDRIDAYGNKLVAAKEAAKEYLQAMQSRSSLPSAEPIGVSVIGFNVATSKIASAYNQVARDAVDQMTAYGETDIGLALDEALDELRAASYIDGGNAVKRILLVSDGASTQGKAEEEIFATTIAAARNEGIVVDTIGFGDIGESNASFLQRLADATGGTSYQATDTQALKMNFFMAYNALMKQVPSDTAVANAQPRTDYSAPMLVIAGLVLIVLLALTLALTFSRSASRASSYAPRGSGRPPAPPIN